MAITRRVQGADLQRRKLHEEKGKNRSWNDRRGLADHKDKLNLRGTHIEDFPTPKWMTEEEKEVFEELRDLVVHNNIAKQTDNYSLRMLATRYTEYVELCEAVKREGYIVEYTTNSGSVQRKANPLITARDNAFKDSKSLLVEFGLTPSSRRSVIKAEPEKADNSEEDEWDAILN